MLETLLKSPFFQFFTVWIPLTTFVWWFFDKFEESSSKERKKALTLWLKNDKTIDVEWTSIFIRLFDSIFGKRPFSWSFFYRSCLVSGICLTFSSLIIYFSFPEATSILKPEASLVYAILMVFLGLFVNFIPDYISLVETRFVLKKFKSNSIFRIFILVLVDLVLTTAIICGTFLLFGFLLSDKEGRSGLLELVLSLFLPIVITSYLTSIWIWLFFLGSLITKLLNLGSLGRNKMGKYFDIENKPFKSVGFVTVVFLTIALIPLIFF